MKVQRRKVDVVAFDAAWSARWGGQRPVGYELRHDLPERWVRFHALPESKSLAGNEAEHAEMCRRHLTAMADLCEATGTPSDDLVVITASWSGSRKVKERTRRVRRAFPARNHWRTLTTDPTDTQPYWTHLFAGYAPRFGRAERVVARRVRRDCHRHDRVPELRRLAVCPVLRGR